MKLSSYLVNCTNSSSGVRLVNRVYTKLALKGAVVKVQPRFCSVSASLSNTNSNNDIKLTKKEDLEISNSLKLIQHQLLLGDKISEEAIQFTLLKFYERKEFENFWELIDFWFRIIEVPSAYSLKLIAGKFIEEADYTLLENLINFTRIRNQELALHLGQYLLNIGISTNSDLELVKFIFNLNFKYYLLLSTKQFNQFLIITGLKYHPLMSNLLNNFQLNFLFNQLSLKRRLPYTLDLINLIQKLGVELNTTSYNLVLKVMAAINPQIALKFFDSLQNTKKGEFEPTLGTYLNLITGIAITKGELTRAHNVMNKLPATIPRYFKVILMNVMLKGYFKNRSLPIAIDYFYEMRKHYYPDLVTCTIVLTQLNNDTSHVETDMYKDVLNLVHSDLNNMKKTPGHLTLNLLFQCYLKVDLEEAYKIAKRIENHIDPPTVHYYSTRITHALRQTPAKLDVALEFLRQYIIRGFQLNNDIVSEIFTQIKLQKDIERVERLRKLLRMANYSPSIDQLIDNFIIRVNLGLPPLNTKRWRSKFY